jgi:ubiquinone/menaquinone biosynthesis C-methylase UbiE
VVGDNRFTLSILSSPKGRILDCGSGWGGLAFWLAKEFNEVHAFDCALDGLQFIEIRAEQEGVSNLKTAQGSILSLPYPNDFFDVVVLNGVLEWVGTFWDDHPPEKLQEIALKETLRVLRPQGTLFLAIENRYGLQYFLGYKEEHTGLRFISLLPRRLDNLYHRIRRGKDFRALTHSRTALEGMLRNSGFTEMTWLFVHPSYRNCRLAATLDGLGGLRFLVGDYLSDEPLLQRWMPKFLLKGLLKIDAFLRLGIFFSPSWMVFACPTSPPRLALRTMNGLVDLRAPGTEIAVAINDRRANFFSVEESDGRLTAKYSLPVNEKASRKTQMSFAFWEAITELQPALGRSFPRTSLWKGRSGYFDHTSAVSGSPIDPNDPDQLKCFLALALELGRLSVSQARMEGVFADFDIRKTLMERANELGFDRVFRESLNKPQFIHGDLNAGNILMHLNESLHATLIDFEHAKIGPAVLNWYDFLLRNFVIAGDELPLNSETVIGRFKRLPGSVEAHTLLSDLTVQFLRECDVPLARHRQYVALYMHHLCQDPIVDRPEKALGALSGMELSL